MNAKGVLADEQVREIRTNGGEAERKESESSSPSISTSKLRGYRMRTQIPGETLEVYILVMANETEITIKSSLFN